MGHERLNGVKDADPPGEPVLRHLHQENEGLLLDLLHPGHHLLHHRDGLLLWSGRWKRRNDSEERYRSDLHGNHHRRGGRGHNRNWVRRFHGNIEA